MTTENNVDWQLVVERGHSTLFLDILFQSQKTALMEQTIGFPFSFGNIQKRGLALRYDRVQLSAAQHVLRTRWQCDGPKVFQDLANACQVSCDALMTLVHLPEFTNLTATRPTLEFLALFDRYVAQMTQHACFIQIMTTAQNELLQIILSRFSEDADEAQTVMRLLTPAYVSERVRSTQDLLALGCEVQGTPHLSDHIKNTSTLDIIATIGTSHPEVWDLIRNHAQTYAWMGRSYFSGPCLSEFEIVDALKELLADKCSEKRDAMSATRAQRRARKELALDRMPDSAELHLLVGVLEKFLHLKDHRLEVMFMAHERVVPLFNFLAQRAHVALDDLLFLTSAEIRACFTTAKPAALMEKAVARQERLSATMINGEIAWDDEQPHEFLTIKPSSVQGGVRRFTGDVCCRGQASGTARVLMGSDDIDRLEQDDILVAPMLVPEIVRGVHKVRAIVTSEGGVLSHAAIVSRELNIPCITGIEDITTTVKDGDFIKVNAETGVVEVYESMEEKLII
mgnify:CR=1 FL=1